MPMITDASANPDSQIRKRPSESRAMLRDDGAGELISLFGRPREDVRSVGERVLLFDIVKPPRTVASPQLARIIRAENSIVLKSNIEESKPSHLVSCFDRPRRDECSIGEAGVLQRAIRNGFAKVRPLASIKRSKNRKCNFITI